MIVKAVEEDEEFKEEVKELIDGVLELVGGEVKQTEIRKIVWI